ncbi:ABC transporter ATP-binding protein [Bacillus sp. FJAT-28004]|uniref:ABC transporter ATP-binding protein n=1 Tax=Bacillus sp. FJAT-28004 TaxID=1679165 RepID=UPI0006B449E6|nr:ABC transporter ATP-binding protein [Bacillus sp. FJAT-28004]
MANWRWLSPYLRSMKWSLLLAVILCLLDMISLLGITGIQKWLIDDVLIGKQYEMLVPYLCIFAALIIGYNAVHLFSFMLNRSNEYTLQKKLTVDLMAFLYKMKASKYNNDRIGSIAQRISGDINETAWTVGHFIPGGIMNIIQVLILSILIGWANPSLLIGVTAVSVFLVFLGKRTGPSLKSVSKEIQQEKAEVLVQIEEGIASTREVIAFNRHKWEIAKYLRSFDRYFAKMMQEGKLQNKQLAWSETCRWGTNLLVIGYGAYLAISGEISIGTFVIVYQFSTQLMEALNQAFGFTMNFASKSGSIERLEEYMTDHEPQTGSVLNEAISEIRFCDVVFRYTDEGITILDQLSIDIPAGKKIAFVGASGGGKSTIAQLLERFYEPVEGQILINNRPLKDLSISRWRDRVSLVSQEPYLFPDTIYNNLVLGRAGVSEEEVIRYCNAVEIHEFIDSLPDGYQTLIGERGITLSGGQRQRLAIARSLLSEPEVLILDEATSALDLGTERRVQRNLDALRAGKTTIIIAHRLSTVENADIIYVLGNGKLIESGSHIQLLQKASVYKSLVATRN